MINLCLIPNHVWVEQHTDLPHGSDADACDVIVEMEDGGYYTALFVTLPYLQRQMELSYQVSKQLPDAPPVRYAALETPHVLAPDLERETIEDILDNLLALDTFHTLFTPVQDDFDDEPLTTPTMTLTDTRTTTKRTTAEVAAVVVSELLRAQPESAAY